MGAFSIEHWIIVLLIVLILFGAKRIPEIAGSFGKGIREFKRSMTDVERSIREPTPDERTDALPRSESRLPQAGDEDRRSEPKRLT
jgi:sec-independent protein translocase protein TatA